MTKSEINRIAKSNLLKVRRAKALEAIKSRTAKASVTELVKKSNKPIITNVLRDKLNALLKMFPDNKFYQSLSKWKGAFTPSQSSTIERHYERFIQSPIEFI